MFVEGCHRLAVLAELNRKSTALIYRRFHPNVELSIWPFLPYRPLDSTRLRPTTRA